MISQDQARQFERQGYLVLERAVPAEMCAQVRRLIADLRGGKRSAGYFKPESPSGPLFQSHLEEPLIRSLVCRESIRDALTSLLGAPPMICQSMFFLAGSRTRAHQDEFFMAPSPPPLIGSWIAVQDVSIEDGPLGVIPGSHLGPVTLAKDVPGQWWKDSKVYDAMIDRVATYADRSRGVPLTARAGDVIFFHGRLIHWGVEPAAPGRSRLSLVSHHCRADAVLDDSNNGIALTPLTMDDAPSTADEHAQLAAARNAR